MSTKRGQPHTAEDLVQDALLSVFRTLRRSPSIQIQHERAYLATAVVRAYADRNRLKMNSETPSDDSRLDESATASTPMDHVADLDLIWRTLATLPAVQRTALVLRYYLDQPDAEIAKIMACPESTVRSHARRALHRLQTGTNLKPAAAAVPPRKGPQRA